MILSKFKTLHTIVALACSLTLSGTAWAQKDRNAPAAKKSSLEASKRVKYKDKTSVDFDAANIDGSVKNPFGSIVNSRDQDFDKGFIKLRYHWHDQMVMSLSGLSGN
jgi:hypothetical protein